MWYILPVCINPIEKKLLLSTCIPSKHRKVPVPSSSSFLSLIKVLLCLQWNISPCTPLQPESYGPFPSLLSLQFLTSEDTWEKQLCSIFGRVALVWGPGTHASCNLPVKSPKSLAFLLKNLYTSSQCHIPEPQGSKKSPSAAFNAWAFCGHPFPCLWRILPQLLWFINN